MVKPQTIQITDPSGEQLLCAFTKGWMICTGSRGDTELIEISYKRDLYQLKPEDVQGGAWELSHVFIEDYYGSDPFGEYDYVDPAHLQMDYRFVLNQDKTASLLVNYVPQMGQWRTEGLTLYIETESGAVLTLEEQYDHSLFGTYKYAPDAEALHVEFDPIDDLTFTEPLPADLFDGAWKLSSLHDSACFHHPAEELTFTQTIEISGGKALHSQEGEDGSHSMEFTMKVVGGPCLEDNHTGTILLLCRSDGVTLPCWLLEDSSLYLRIPGSTCYYYTKQ